MFLLVVPPLVGRQVTEPPKREPPPRSIEVPAQGEAAPGAVQDQRAEADLPRIELPEYVITGVASIDLPDVLKMIPEEQGVLRAGQQRGPGRREFFAYSPRWVAEGGKDPSQLPETHARLSASFATFLTPTIDAWFGQRYEDFDYGVSASYFKTNGFAPQTNRSGGAATVDGGLLLKAENPYFNAARLSGDLRYFSETYRFYGGLDPSLKRTNDAVRLDAGFSSSTQSPWQYAAGVAYSTYAVKESSLTARQDVAEFSLAADVPTPVVPLAAAARAQLGSRTGIAEGNYSMIQLGVESQRGWWSSFFAQAGVNLYVAKGMSGQQLTRLYPSAGIGYRFPSVHSIMLGYQPRVSFSRLDLLVGRSPYLSSGAVIRHVDMPLRFAGILESEWSDLIVTRATVRWELWKDEPLFSDSTERGVWELEYLGTTTRLEVELEAFANISSNGYFAVSIVARSSKVRETSVSVPYLPETEVSLLYGHDFPGGITLLPRLSFFGRRNTRLEGEQFLNGYAIAGLRAEYAPLPSLKVFADLDNLLDVRYEVWKGYQGHPFLMTAGVSYSW
jgi:hypothetical protein